MGHSLRCKNGEASVAMYQYRNSTGGHSKSETETE
jgi:hypothetical protein